MKRVPRRSNSVRRKPKEPAKNDGLASRSESLDRRSTAGERRPSVTSVASATPGQTNPPAPPSLARSQSFTSLNHYHMKVRRKFITYFIFFKISSCEVSVDI